MSTYWASTVGVVGHRVSKDRIGTSSTQNFGWVQGRVPTRAPREAALPLPLPFAWFG